MEALKMLMKRNDVGPKKHVNFQTFSNGLNDPKHFFWGGGCLYICILGKPSKNKKWIFFHTGGQGTIHTFRKKGCFWRFLF